MKPAFKDGGSFSQWTEEKRLRRMYGNAGLSLTSRSDVNLLCTDRSGLEWCGMIPQGDRLFVSLIIASRWLSGAVKCVSKGATITASIEMFSKL